GTARPGARSSGNGNVGQARREAMADRTWRDSVRAGPAILPDACHPPQQRGTVGQCWGQKKAVTQRVTAKALRAMHIEEPESIRAEGAALSSSGNSGVNQGSFLLVLRASW